MAQATSISFSKFRASVKSAVKAAVAKNPKFKGVEPPNDIWVSYLIRGFPPPESVLASVSVGELQSFANDVASHISSEHAELAAAAGGAPQGAIISIGRHIICGIPPVILDYKLTE